MSDFRKTIVARLRSSHVASATISVVLLAVLVLIFSPVWKDDSGDGEVKKIYFVDDISPAHQEVIDLFNRKYKGRIEVVPLNIPFATFSTNERKELFARFLRSKSNQIDVFSVDGIWIPRFAKWCEPLDNFFSPEERQSIVEYALQPCFYEGKLVTVPLFIDVALLYYRKDIIDALPDGAAIESELQKSITWDRFIELSRRFNSSKNPPYVFQADSYEGLICSFAEMLEGLRNPLYANGQFHLATAQAVRATSLLRDLVGRYRISPPAVTDFRENSSVEFFLQHNGVFLRGWPTVRQDFQSLTSHHPLDPRNLCKAPVPHFQGFPPVSMLGGWNLMVSKYSTQKAEAMVFLKFLLSKEAQTILYEEGGYLPTNRSMYQDSIFLAKHDDLGFYWNLFKSGVRRPSLVEYTKYSDIISRFLKLSITRELSPQEALRSASEEIGAEESARRGSNKSVGQ